MPTWGDWEVLGAVLAWLFAALSAHAPSDSPDPALLVILLILLAGIGGYPKH